jgi:hypothetical protein
VATPQQPQQRPQAPVVAEPPTGGQPQGGNAGPGAASAGSPEGSRPFDPREEMVGLRAWVGQIDRRLGVLAYVGAALAMLAVAAAAVALVLTLSLKQDSPTKDEVDSLRDQLTVVEQSASQAAESGVQSLNQRLSVLESEVDKLSADQTTSERELEVVQDDIKELRSQASGTQPAPGSSSATGNGFGDSSGGGTTP